MAIAIARLGVMNHKSSQKMIVDLRREQVIYLDGLETKPGN